MVRADWHRGLPLDRSEFTSGKRDYRKLNDHGCRSASLLSAEWFGTFGEYEPHLPYNRVMRPAVEGVGISMLLDVPPASIEERAANSAVELWELLSPQKPLFPEPCHLLYRGQADASWQLEPSILRGSERKLGVLLKKGQVNSDDQVFKELVYLRSFVEYCDSIGLRCPNDSPDFRNLFLNIDAPSGPGGAFIRTSLWPDPKLYDLMALAQHYGLPTRLLNWSGRSYVAAYFAVSGALSAQQSGSGRLAVWVLNVTQVTHFQKLEIVKVPGSNNANIAARMGMFTLLRQDGIRGKAFEGEMSLDQYFIKLQSPISIPLMKVTLPVSEAKAALRLCSLYGITGATLFPDFYGAARAAKDMMQTSWRNEAS